MDAAEGVAAVKRIVGILFEAWRGGGVTIVIGDGDLALSFGAGVRDKMGNVPLILLCRQISCRS